MRKIVKLELAAAGVMGVAFAVLLALPSPPADAADARGGVVAAAPVTDVTALGAPVQLSGYLLDGLPSKADTLDPLVVTPVEYTAPLYVGPPDDVSPLDRNAIDPLEGVWGYDRPNAPGIYVQGACHATLSSSWLTSGASRPWATGTLGVLWVMPYDLDGPAESSPAALPDFTIDLSELTCAIPLRDGHTPAQLSYTVAGSSLTVSDLSMWRPQDGWWVTRASLPTTSPSFVLDVAILAVPADDRPKPFRA